MNLCNQNRNRNKRKKRNAKNQNISLFAENRNKFRLSIAKQGPKNLVDPKIANFLFPPPKKTKRITINVNLNGNEIDRFGFNRHHQTNRMTFESFLFLSKKFFFNCK